MHLRAILTLAIASVTADASITRTFDFENLVSSLGRDNRGDYSSPLKIVDDGVSITVSHENGIVFLFNEKTNTSFVAQFGSRLLDAFNTIQGAADPGAFLLDFGEDGDWLVRQAFSGVGGTGTRARNLDGNFVDQRLTASLVGGCLAVLSVAGHIGCVFILLVDVVSECHWCRSRFKTTDS